MNLLRILQSRSKLFYLFMILLGFISSITSIGILMLISMVLGAQPLSWFAFLKGYEPLAFIILLVVSFAANRFFQNYVVNLTNNILFDLELSIVQKIRMSRFESFEKMGTEKILAAIGDARTLSRIPEIFITLVNSFITVICSLAYLFWVSLPGGIAILVVLFNLLIFYVARNEKLQANLNEVRTLQNTYYKSLQELLFGFKQVRISTSRNNNLYNKFILVNRERAKKISVSTSKSYVINQLIGSYSWYLLFGIVLFVLPALLRMDVGSIAAFITSVLFMMTPTSQLISFIPFYTTCKIALERINDLYKQLEVNGQPAGNGNPAPDFNTIRFENVTYRYTDEVNSSFTIESLNIEIVKGEILFLVGGNGSGKSTFINLFTGLYKPESGKVYIDEREVGWDDFSSFSNSMAVIYTDHHLFRENYEDYRLSADNPLLQQYQEMLNLEGLLQPDGVQDKVNINLSKGQQKRLALLLGLLENKPLIVLDEWAAEQDPMNRKIFYTQWLKDMVAMGKTVVAVTHDDDFYHLADRVLKFNYGKLQTFSHEYN